MRGCLESLVADPALVATAIERGLVPVDGSIQDGIESLRRLADGGHPEARAIFVEAGSILGRAVAGLVNILSPQLVILSGEGVQAWAHLSTPFEAAFRASTFPSLRGVDLEVDPWDDAKWARGAAALVLRATFAAPLYERQIEDTVRARLNGISSRSGVDAAGRPPTPERPVPVR